MSVILLLTIAILILFVLANSHRWMAVALITGFTLRLMLMLGEYWGFWVVPGNGADSVVFARRALSWSQLSWDHLLDQFNPAHSYVYSWLGAVLYKLLGYHQLILPLVNFCAGILVIGLAGKVAVEVWGRGVARRVAFLVAIFPFAAFNSVVVLREELPILCFVAGLLWLVRWSQGRSRLGVWYTILLFSLAALFHSGWIAAIMGLSGFLLFSAVGAGLRGVRTGTASKVDVRMGIISSAILIVCAFILPGSDIALSKGLNLGQIDAEFISDTLSSSFDGSRGGSGYPALIATGDPLASPWLIPARMVYFLFSPFPWDIRALQHLAGLAASLVFAWACVRIYRFRAVIWKRRDLLALAAVTFAIVLAFSIGTTNIGTSIRHRTKVLVAVLVLSAGLRGDQRRQAGLP